MRDGQAFGLPEELTCGKTGAARLGGASDNSTPCEATDTCDWSPRRA